MALKIVIPERTHEEFGHSISRLLQIVSSIVSAGELEIELDFSQARMLNPFFLGGIACTLKLVQSMGKEIRLNYGENFKINSYLERIFFPQSFSPKKDDEETFFRQLDEYQTRTYIPIISFPTGFEDEIEALSFAVNGRSTKDRPESKGFGISTSRKMLVHGLRGKFFIWTGNSTYIETIEREGLAKIPDKYYFQGTLVALRIPTIIPDKFNFYEYIE